MSRFIQNIFKEFILDEELSSYDKKLLQYLEKEPKNTIIFGVNINTLIQYIKQEFPPQSKYWSDETWDKLEKAKIKLMDKIQ